MADAVAVHRKYLKAAVGALCSEKGYDSITRQAIETLTEMIQSYIGEIGRSSLAICELSGRSKPTLNDVRLALVEMGLDVDGLNTNLQPTAKAFLIPRPTVSRPFQQPKPLQSGTKEGRPAYVPNYLPSFPDPHSYVKTLTYRREADEYEKCREKYAAMRRDVETGLAKFLSKTSISEPIVKNCANSQDYLLIVNEPATLPYLTALMPTAEDAIVPVKPDKTPQDSEESTSEKPVQEPMDNPFLKPPKRRKTTAKS
ncbi:transcription initiation factor TFIID subunit 8-like [Dendronephthya gigantea]|uniref:transcription initiation factor TFIID subunit 8-like n=1 Tax=Dendronephthya gigantea TaxID=151771 RepID=UPI00106945D6|nr:transcription initiation factor TFIID subunit 8-like [Dendronephthya gigantea]